VNVYHDVLVCTCMYMYAPHSENWIFFTFDIRICCTVHGKRIPPYINLKEMSSIGPLIGNRQCSGTLYTSIYQYRNYVFGTTWYIPVHTSMTCLYWYIPCCTNSAVFIQVVEIPDVEVFAVHRMFLSWDEDPILLFYLGLIQGQSMV
jgi:hypothetical protein